MRSHRGNIPDCGRVLNWVSGRSALRAGTVFCIGRNYADHARELGNELPTEPMVFLKTRNSIVGNGAKVRIPNYSEDMHYEAELVLIIGQADSKPVVTGISVGIDFTLRDIQSDIKQKGHPWTKAKNFKGATAISDIYDMDVNEFGVSLDDIGIRLIKNGEVMQDGNTSQMVFPAEKLVDGIEGIYGLELGDLIFTGTPSGVGNVVVGDRLEALISYKGRQLSTLKIDIA